jgi:hypothetical protein
MREKIPNLMFFVLSRIVCIFAVTGIFLPPDAQNPHVWGDVFLACCGGLMWAGSDILLIRLKGEMG